VRQAITSQLQIYYLGLALSFLLFMIIAFN